MMIMLKKESTVDVLKKMLLIIIQIGLLFVFSTIGTWIQHYFDLFIPGSVIGLVLLFTLLMTGIIRLDWIEEGARFMTNHLVLFFIPATIGFINYYHLFAGRGFILVLITIISTLLVMVIAGLISQRLARRREIENE